MAGGAHGVQARQRALPGRCELGDAEQGRVGALVAGLDEEGLAGQAQGLVHHPAAGSGAQVQLLAALLIGAGELGELAVHSA